LGGFIASTYNRGIPLVMIPSSLLAMVDAGIGGKNGVDTPAGKNLIGTFYQPKQIIIDPDLLKTLPIREIRNGLVEMIKHALIADKDYFTFFQTHVDKILELDSEALEQAIYQSGVIKKTIVEEDEKETGKRRLLNCGHTIAHALEHLSNYEIAHGEAVAIGIVIEGYAANRLGYLPMEDLNLIIDLFKRFGIPLRDISKINLADIINALILDKKSLKGKPRFVLLEKIGVPVAFDGQYCTTINEDQLLNALSWYNHAMHSH
jgi:3-dehydroquinate synthase